MPLNSKANNRRSCYAGRLEECMDVGIESNDSAPLIGSISEYAHIRRNAETNLADMNDIPTRFPECDCR